MELAQVWAEIRRHQMIKLVKKKQLTTIAVLVILVMMVALPSVGSDSEHQTLSLATIEPKILEDNIAIERAELAVEIAEVELAEAEDNQNDSGDSTYEKYMNRRYYVKQAEMNLYVAQNTLSETQRSEVLSGGQIYYNYLLLVENIDIKNRQLLRLNEELNGVNKKIELGASTINDRTSKELEIAKATYELMQLQDDKEILFLDLNLALRQDLSTVLVIEGIEIPFEAYAERDLSTDLDYLLTTNVDLWQLEKQDELDAIQLDIYGEFDRDSYESEAKDLTSTIKQNALDIADKQLNLEYELRSKYNAVLNGYDSVMIKELELDNLKMALETLTKRFDVGFETENTVKAAQENFDSGALAVLQAKLDYYVAVETYKNFLN